jgi:oleandomycin transport system ATP-binding protein
VAEQPHRVRSLIGLTGQYAAVDGELSGRENLVLIGRLLEKPRAQSRARADELLERFALTDAARRSVKTYSGGMRRRLDLAASLFARPEVLFLDEPTTGLDPRSRGDVWDLVRGLVQDGVTVLLTTQYLDEADRLANDIAVIDHGRLIASGTPAELKAKVGGQTLDVRPAEPADLQMVAAIVGDLTGGQAERDDDRLLVSAPVEGSDVMAAVLRRLQEYDIELTEFALRLASPQWAPGSACPTTSTTASSTAFAACRWPDRRR